MSPDFAPPSVEPLQEWLDAARAGSREALGRLLWAYRPYLVAAANNELGADLQAKAGGSDLVQQTFLEAHQDFDAFHGKTPADLLAWLRRMLLNNVANLRRCYAVAEKRQVQRELSLEANPGVEHNPAVLDEHTPQRTAMAREEAERVREALDRLPENYRRVLVLRHHEDKSFAEIGAALGVSAEAARKLWSRAVVRLRETMGPPT